MDGVVTIRTVGHELALKAAAAAVAKGATVGCPVVAAVVGAGGDLVAFLRASGSPSPSAKIAQDKAYSAASFRVPTPELYAMVAGNPALRDGIVAQPGIAMFGGGLPIEIAGEFVGAIGVSGGSEAMDVEFANAGLAAVGAKKF
ncbi:uncharacterized protein GlcG (DUF336 family) [Novosphingobium kunmingense]|uniref:Uncharacterized protein GlcG (DUF336 family) n=1 Tax=Novosphingobium kunmingense TaxID=1211806 RepID=A0A2N0H3T1_9SPHN|nr:heme-binding protein [Novosphingobium kunmingense]PKB13591.1 uncharacterized protein GlcG (DUF336 family) [Novosphingobium kunmingense]